LRVCGGTVALQSLTSRVPANRPPALGTQNLAIRERMNMNNLLLTLALGVSCAAYAQTATTPAAPAPSSSSSSSVSHDCKEEAKKLCGRAHGSEMQDCIKSNLDLNKFSAACATEFKNAAATKKPSS
jgi:hypothetical protein